MGTSAFSAMVLDVGVGPYSLALPAAEVLGVLANVPCDATVTRYQHHTLEVIDLPKMLLGQAATSHAFVVACQLDGRGDRYGLAVDRVGRMVTPSSDSVFDVPPWGLEAPELLLAARRYDHRLLFALDVAALVRHAGIGANR